MAKRVRGWQGAKPYTLFVPDGNLGDDCTPVIVQSQEIVAAQSITQSGGTLTRFAYNVDPATTTFGAVVNLNPDEPAATRADLDTFVIVSSTIAAATSEYPPFRIVVEIGTPVPIVPVLPQTYGIPIINANGCTAYLEFFIPASQSPGVL